jgi:large subunit ribosomal protein L20
MPRATNSPATRKRQKKFISAASGYWGNKSRLYRYAQDAVNRAGQYSYMHRRTKKRDFRALWIVRINAACRANGLPYSRFMEGLKLAGVALDRKALSELAIHDEAAFVRLVETARGALAAKA